MIDDQTYAVRWVIAERIADPKRICLDGASYGAHAAMVGAARDPDLYQCARGNVGVYDLPLPLEDQNVANCRADRDYFHRAMGEAPELLAQVLPTALAEKTRSPGLPGRQSARMDARPP